MTILAGIPAFYMGRECLVVGQEKGMLLVQHPGAKRLAKHYPPQITQTPWGDHPIHGADEPIRAKGVDVYA